MAAEKPLTAKIAKKSREGRVATRSLTGPFAVFAAFLSGFAVKSFDSG
jgi:hypothetical protein